MKYTKLLSLSLVILTLVGCNKSDAINQSNNFVKPSNVSQDNSSNTTINEAKSKSDSTITTKVKQSKLKTKSGKQIGQLIDCDNDGLQDDARIDNDGDGIPDDCLIGNQKPQVQIDETSFETVSKSLESITKGCNKTEKAGEYSKYEICKKGDTIVNASEYAPEAGAGLAYWFAPDNRVVAIRDLSSGVLSIFDSSGKVTSQFDVYESKKINNISAEERKNLQENVYGGYKDILKAFNL